MGEESCMRKFCPTSNFPIHQMSTFSFSFLIRQPLDFSKTLVKFLVPTEEKLFRAQNLKFASRCALLLVKFWALVELSELSELSELCSNFRLRARGFVAPTQLLYM